MRLRLLALLLALAAASCKATTGRGGASSPKRDAACAAIAQHVNLYTESLASYSIDAKARVQTYAGLLEFLLALEGASARFDGELAARRFDGDLGARVTSARAALGRTTTFAKDERSAVEKHAHDIAPLAKETQQAWTALRTACEERRKVVDCHGVREVVARYDAAESTADHDKAVSDLVALRLTTPTARLRDRAVAASRSIQAAIKARGDTSAPLPDRWSTLQKDLFGTIGGLVEVCRDEPMPMADLVASDRPDPRKLTVLVHMKPPAGVEKSLLSLAQASRDPDERAFYRGRAEGAFGSGFVLVQKTATGGTETFIVTNRHVVELGDRAALELADGTSLGPADVVYDSPTYDLAVLRPTAKIPIKAGFALSHLPAKDQQTVIATGFPGLVGRPSYQTTKGYVSNESFRLDDGTRPLLYVQHTAPIDPGSSGGPLTDESGRILGVNTMKVTGREAVGLAVPSRYVLDTIRTAVDVESGHASTTARVDSARRACLGFLAELGVPDSRPTILEQMISNHLVGVEGLDDAAALASEEGFDQLWTSDSVRAMRIATLVRVRSSFMIAGGPSVLETCADLQSDRPDVVTYRIRLGNFETRELAFRWEHGRWKVDAFEAGTTRTTRPVPKKLPAPSTPPAGPPQGKKISPPPKR